MTTCRLSRVALGLAAGTLWGLTVLILGLVAHFVDYGMPFVNAMGMTYLGSGPTILGSILGGFIGFIHAFVTGFFLAWLYNAYAHCGCKTIEDTKKPESDFE